MGYWEELEKLRRERLEKGRKENQRKMLYRNKTATAEDIAPVSEAAPTTKRSAEEEAAHIDALLEKAYSEMTPEEREAAKKESEKAIARRNGGGWFKSGNAFDDGYQVGDVFKTINNSANDLATNIAAGILGIGEKVVDAGAMGAGWVGGLFGADKFKENMGEFVAKDLYDEKKLAQDLGIGNSALERFLHLTGLHKTDWNEVEAQSVFGDKSDSLAQSGGQLLGTMALQSVGVPWFLTTPTTSFGGETESALREGASYDEAALSGVITAGAELLSEKLFGGSGLGEKGLINVDIFTKNITNKAIKALADFGIDIAGESIEEPFSEFISTLGQQLTYEKEATWQELLSDEKAMDDYIHQVGDALFGKEAWKNYGDAAIGGALLGGFANVGKVSNSVKTKTDYRTGLTANEEAVVNKEVEKRIAEKEAKGEKVTKNDKAKIYDSVVKDLEKGYISTDTIEEALGGDAFKSYQDSVKSNDSLVEQEKALKEEFDELNKMKKMEMTGEQSDRLEELRGQLTDIRAKISDPQSKTNREQLKARLSEGVYDIAKNDRLVESYNEVARRQQAFEADVSKYSKKQQAAVQRAIDSGVLNNSNRSHELVDMISKLEADKGVTFDFANNAKLKESGFALDGKVVNGLVTKDGITINVESHKALDTIAGHEITHVLEGTELYSELQKAIFVYAKKKGDFEGRYDTLAELYSGVEGANVYKELTADLVGDYLFSDADFISNLSAEHRNVFQKIYDEIKYLYKIATAGSKEARELERVKNLFEKVYKDGGKSSGDTKYSVSDSNITDESTGYAYGESYYTMSYKQDGKVVGTLEYGEYDGEPNVKMIEVAPEYRRQGIGTKLLQELQKKYPDVEIDFGMSTPDGTKLLDSITYDVTDEAVVADRQKLKDLQTELNDLQEKLDVLYDTENLTEAQENELHELGDRWQEVYETIHDLEQSLRGKRATKTFVKTDANPTSDPDIRYSLSEDSEGRKLSENQEKYFANSVVRDDSGKLLAVKHGTNEDFHIFDFSRIGKNGKAEGYGFYFSDDPEITERYGGIQKEVYLNITKPLSQDKKTMKKADLAKFVNAVIDLDISKYDADGLTWQDSFISNYVNTYERGMSRRYAVQEFVNQIWDYNTNDFDLVYEIANGDGKTYSSESMREFYDVLTDTLGYDGVIAEWSHKDGASKVYVTFNSEQSKYVTNANPTADVDMRRSLSAEGDTSRRFGNIFGEDVRFNAPVAEDLTGTTETAEMTENTAPIQNVTEGENEVVADTENIAPAPEPSAEGLAEFATQARREELRGAYIEDGKQYISDGSFIAELNTVDESIEQSESFPAKRVKNELAEAFERQSGENYELDVAGIDDGYIKVGDSLFDSKYVNAVIRAIENPVFTLSNVRGGDKALLVSGDNGRAVLMPVRAGDNANVVYEARQVDDSVYEDALPSDPNLYDLYREQEDLEKQIQEAMERYDETGDFGKGEELITRLGELSDRIKRMETEERALQKDRLDSLDDADVPPEMEAPYPGEDVAPVDPFADRNMKEVSKDRKVKAYMYENPEVKPFFQEEANYLLGELERTEKPQTIYYGDVKYDMPYDVAKDIPDIHRTPRVATPSIEYLRDTVGMSYADIEKGLKAIIEDNGAENIAAAKKLEFHINDRLLYGYEADGYKMPPNQDYINLLNEKQITEYQEEAKKSFYESINATEVAPVIEKTPDKAYEAIRPPKQSNEPQMKRAEPRMKRVDSTKTAPDGMEERSWYQTSTGSEAVDNMVTPDDIPDDVRYYQVKSNEKTLATANARLAKDGYAKSREYFESRMSERKLSVEDIALGERLIQEAAKAGDAKAVRDLIIDVSIIGTELGQRVQALSMIRRLTPEGQLKALTRTVERGKAKGDKAFEGVEITQEMIDHILKTYGKDGTFDQTELNAAVEDVKQQIADQMSVGAMDYINAWRYLSMLGNPKTHIRNVVSNVAMLGTRTVKNAVARTAEDVFLRKKKPVLITDDIAPTIGDTARKGEVKGQQQMFSEAQPTRTKTWKRASDVVKDFAKQTTKEMESAIKGENKYSDEGGIKAKRNIFKTKAGNWMANANNTAMDFEDSIFSKQAFRQTLSEYLTANGIKTEADIKNNPALVEKAKDYALEEARKATFRQDSYLANKISEIERKNPFLGMAVGSIMPFKKTPINIAKTGLAYSPLGFARNIYDAVQVGKGKMDASEAIDHLAQTLTGTSLALIGYALAEAGILNGAGDDDKEGKYDYQLGEQSYSFNFGGDSYSLSWLSPIAMPLFVGANAYEQLVEGKEWNPDVVTEALAQTLDPLSEMSFISSLDDVLSSYDSGVAKIWGAGESMIQNYITQFVPTLSSQIAQTADDTKRSTKVAADSSFKFGEETLNKIKYKIPGLRNTLEPTTDIWGNEVKQSDNVLARGFEAFFSPANRKEDITTAVDEELKDLYGQTGDAGVMPSIPDNYINYDGNKYEMSARDYTEYKEAYGQTAFDLMEQLFDTETYKNADSETRADMVNRVYDYARDEARKGYFTKFGVDFTNAQEEGEEVYKENPIKGAIETDLPVDEYVFSKDYPERYAFFKNNGISYATYKAADEYGKRAYTWAAENPEKFTLSKAVADDVVEYRRYAGELYDIKADKDSSGKSIVGSRKEKVLDYINGLDIDYGARLILFKSEYKADDTYNYDIIDYLNGRDDISYEEMVTILKELDFTVDKYGNISWD